jgi:hypothetical protein
MTWKTIREAIQMSKIACSHIPSVVVKGISITDPHDLQIILMPFLPLLQLLLPIKSFPPIDLQMLLITKISPTPFKILINLPCLMKLLM